MALYLAKLTREFCHSKDGVRMSRNNLGAPVRKLVMNWDFLLPLFAFICTMPTRLPVCMLKSTFLSSCVRWVDYT